MSEDSSPPKAGDLTGRTLDDYKIGPKLGDGGMATVYLAEQAPIGRTVAIKILPPHFTSDDTFVQRFEREVRVIAELQHPRVLPVYDYGEIEGRPFIVMAYMAGGTLSDRIRQGPLSLDETVKLIAQIAEGLDHAHTKGVVHRDFKPSNVLLDEQGNAYLADFGIAKINEATIQLTGTGVVGTPAYMAPEMGSQGTVSPLVDIYALGVTLYQMLTGRFPFQGETPLSVMLAHATKPVPDVRAARPDVPPGVAAVIHRAMAKNPADRYQTAGEMAAALRQAVDNLAGDEWIAAGHRPHVPAGGLPPADAPPAAPLLERAAAATIGPPPAPPEVVPPAAVPPAGPPAPPAAQTPATPATPVPAAPPPSAPTPVPPPPPVTGAAPSARSTKFWAAVGIGLILASLACIIGSLVIGIPYLRALGGGAPPTPLIELPGRTPEVEVVPPVAEATAGPDESEPAAPTEIQSEPGGQSVVMVINNESTSLLCDVFISPRDADEWGPDQLGDGVVVNPGDSFTLGDDEAEGVLAAGEYDLLAVDCDDGVVDEHYAVEILGPDYVWRIREADSALTVANNSSLEVCELYVSAQEDGIWGAPRLAEGEIIPVGGSVVVNVAPAEWDLRAVACDGETYWEEYMVDVAGAHEWELSD